jgi:alginate O-acetyltransferase complex protein AlgI
MLFNSFNFLFIFLPVLLTVYAVFITQKEYKKFIPLVILVFSFAFYLYWDIQAFFILLLSMSGNFVLGNLILLYSGRKKKLLLILGITLNLLAIFYYKYTNFLLASLNAVTNSSFSNIQIILPLGISFYTFTQIAFLVDVYKGKSETKGLVNYALFVTFFPHLIAGPIVLFNKIQDQLLKLKENEINWEMIYNGLCFFVMGLSKKVLIADNLIVYVKPVFESASVGNLISFTDAWIGAISYTLQLYFDFSGYSEMAIGLGLIFGVTFPSNFNSPYKSYSIVEFWRRWHITLSEFLRDYLYIPLGGNRNGLFRKNLNLLITMLLGGLWHGAGWTYVVWGGLHGIALIINHNYKKVIGNVNIPKTIGIGMTFIFVVNAWVFFRANSLQSAFSIISSMYDFKFESSSVSINALIKILAALLVVFVFPNTSEIIKNKIFYRAYGTIFLMILFYFSLLAIWIGNETEFLYFQF